MNEQPIEQPPGAQETNSLSHTIGAAVPPARDSGIVPWRAIFLGLLLGPLCCYWAQDQNVDRIFSLMIPPVILTLALVVINIPVRRFLSRHALTQAELIVFYGMQSVMCAMASEWVEEVHGYIYSYAVSDSSYIKEQVVPHLSPWLFFTDDKGPLKGFVYGGKTAAFFWASLGPWWPKILAWTLIVTLVALAMLCINALMEKQWAQNERMAFPLVQLPLAMTEGGGASPFWRDRLMWISLAVMFGIDMLNGFAFLYPSLPTINVRFLGDVSAFLNTPPWNAIGWTPIGIFPFIAAIGVLVPTDLLASLLLFFVLRKSEQIVAAGLGFEQGTFGGGGLNPSVPYFSEQSWGAFLGLFVGGVWTALPYLKRLWQQIETGASAAADPQAISPRWAFAGLCGSVAALALLGLAIGVPPLYVLVYVLLFLVFSTAMSRVRAQIGAPTHEMAFMGPHQVALDFHGASGLSQNTVVGTLTTFHFMNRIHRTHPMPSQLEALYLGDRGRVSARGMFFSILAATVAGSVLGHLIRTYLDFRGTPSVPDEPVGLIRTVLGNPGGPNFAAIGAMGLGFAIVIALDFLRFQIPGFFLHPAGFALAMNFGVDYYWFGLLIALTAKVFITRYAGLRGYQSLRKVAFGIMLGEFLAETVWAIYSMLNHDVATYTISINGKMGWDK